MSVHSRRSFLAAGGLLAATALAGCSAATAETREQTTETIALTDASDLTVTNLNGAVTVTTWDENAVELTVLKRSLFGRDQFDRVVVESAVTDGTLAVDVAYTADSAPPRVAVDLDVRVPESLVVSQVGTTNGTVDVTGTTGDGSFSSQNGTVTVTDVDGFVTLTSNNGTVESTGCTGIDGARTANGTVDIELLALRQDVDVSAANGSIEVAVPPALDADVELSAANGTVDVEGVELTDVDRTTRRLTGRLGEGGYRLRLSVANGSAELTAR